MKFDGFLPASWMIHSPRAWLALPFPAKGAVQVVPGARLEMRNCPCGSTLAIVVEGSLDEETP